MLRMGERPFRPGDIVELGGQRGVVLIGEKNDLILVRVEHGAETWNADHCRLVVRPREMPWQPTEGRPEQ